MNTGVTDVSILYKACCPSLILLLRRYSATLKQQPVLQLMIKGMQSFIF